MFNGQFNSKFEFFVFVRFFHFVSHTKDIVAMIAEKRFVATIQKKAEMTNQYETIGKIVLNRQEKYKLTIGLYFLVQLQKIISSKRLESGSRFSILIRKISCLFLCRRFILLFVGLLNFIPVLILEMESSSDSEESSI